MTPIEPDGPVPLPAGEALPVVVARPARWPLGRNAALHLHEVTPRQAGWDAALVIFTAIVAHYAPALLISERAEGAALQLDLRFVAIKWCEAALVVGLALYFICRNGIRLASLGLRPDRIGRQLSWSIGGFFATYLCVLATGYLFILVYRFLPNPEADLRQRLEFFSAMPVNDLLTTVLLLAGVAVHEELLFRGLILTLLRRTCGTWWPAVLINSAIFGALHFQQGAFGMLQAGCLGVVFSLLFIGSRSLPAVMLTHFLFDFVQFQLARQWLPWLMHEYPDLFH